MRERLTGRGAPVEQGPAPTEERLADGQHADHWILSAEERAKGFVRPVRTSYTHTGERPKHPTRRLTDEEFESYDGLGYIAFEKYPEGEAATGRFWTAEQLRGGCGTTTTMPLPIAETYAREPGFYGSTYCAGCREYRPVAEFQWWGTTEQVGS